MSKCLLSDFSFLRAAIVLYSGVPYTLIMCIMFPYSCMYVISHKNETSIKYHIIIAIYGSCISLKGSY